MVDRAPRHEEQTVYISAEEGDARHSFTQIQNDFIRNPALTPSERLLWMILDSYNFHGNGAFPKQRTIADQMCVSVRQVRRLVESLAAKGCLHIEHRDGWRNAYRLVPPNKQPHIAAGQVRPIRPGTGDIHVLSPTRTGDTHLRSQGTPMSPGGDTHVPSPRTPMSPLKEYVLQEDPIEEDLTQEDSAASGDQTGQEAVEVLRILEVESKRSPDTVRRTILRMPTTDPIAVALNYREWQDGLPEKQRKKNHVQAWVNQMEHHARQGWSQRLIEPSAGASAGAHPKNSHADDRCDDERAADAMGWGPDAEANFVEMHGHPSPYAPYIKTRRRAR